MDLLYRLKYAYMWVRAEYFVSFPWGIINFVNLLNHGDHYRGDLLAFAVVTCTQLNDRTGWEVLEDLIYGDMGMFHVGQVMPWITYFSPIFVMFWLLASREKWDLWYDIWPEYDHCRSPTQLILNHQCRPRIYGYKEAVSYYNPKYNFYYVAFTIQFIVFVFIGERKCIRALRAQEVSHRAITPWLKKVKKE